MKYTIVPQVEFNRGEETEVLCKHIKSFRAEKKRRGIVVERKMMRFSFTILKVVLRPDTAPSDGSGDHMITWSNKCKPTGKFICHLPPRMEHPKFKVGGGKTKGKPWDSRRTVEDTLSPKRKVPGEKREFLDHVQFAEYIAAKCGADMASEIVGLFANKLSDMASAKAA